MKCTSVKGVVVSCQPMKASGVTSDPAEKRVANTTQRQLDAAATRDSLIQAAIVCMAHYGHAGVTLQRVTDTAGVSRGLVRHHFGNKQKLLLEAFQRLTDEQRSAFAAGDASDEGDAVATLRTAIVTSFQDAIASPTRMHAWFGFWQAALTDPALRKVNERLYTDERVRYTELFRAAAQQLDLVIDERVAGRGLQALADGVWNQLVIDATDFRVEDALALCNDYIDMVFERGRATQGSHAAS